MTADGKVYGWGDAESGKIGRMSQSRRRIEQSMEQKMQLIYFAVTTPLFTKARKTWSLHGDSTIMASLE
jgi:alpha-tubulin suppressor-like RCC1 family protein